MSRIVPFLTAVLCLLLVGCSNSNEVTNEDVLVPVTVRVNDFTIAQGDIPATRSTALAEYAGVKALTLAFYKGDGTEMYKHTQFREDNTTFTTFGEFTTALPIGSYTMVVLGYGQGSEAQEITLTSPTSATYDEGRVRDTFAATKEITVSNTTAQTHNATLNRIVTQLGLETTDKRPAEVTQVRFTLSAGGKDFNPTTGFALTNTGFSNTLNLNNTAGTISQVSSYFFLATDEQNINVTIETLNESGDVVYIKTITNVPMKRNRFTLLKGPVFSSNVSAGSFQINAEWLERKDVSF